MGTAGRQTLIVPIASCVIATAILIVLEVPWPAAVLAGVGGFVAGRLISRRLRKHASIVGGSIDPFAVGEPWRQFVQGAQRSATKLSATVDSASTGPLKDRMESIVTRLDAGLEETWRIARRGHQIDETVRRLDPVALRSKLDSLRQRAGASPSPDLDAAIASFESQLASTQRLKDESTRTADTLRLAQTRFDELVSRAAEVGIGAADTEVYAHDVDELVVELESLRLAVEETHGS
jgi:ElaB/YqjD/DUF883 family membrane-anchored ribosome-binding protein